MADYSMTRDHEGSGVQPMNLASANLVRNLAPEADLMNIGGLLQSHNEELLKLRELVGMLDDRIAPILGPERPSDAMKIPDGGTPDRSEVGRIVNDHTDLVRSIQRRVNMLLQRIEL